MLTGQKDLAKVSAMPGKTRLINFYRIENSWCLVDLPGYGYAKVSRSARGGFTSSVADYLRHRPNLLGTFVLVDSRIPPQKMDLEFIAWLVGHGIAFALVFTKTDGISAKALDASVAAFLDGMRDITDESPPVLTCSSKTREGRSDILDLIASTLDARD